MFFKCVPLEGNFDIDAGDGNEGGGAFGSPKSPQIQKHRKIFQKTQKHLFFLYIVPPEGNFDVDAGDVGCVMVVVVGGWGGGGKSPQSPKSRKYPQIKRKQNIFVKIYFILYYTFCIFIYLHGLYTLGRPSFSGPIVCFRNSRPDKT